MKQKILGTGLTGLVGSRVVELLKDKYEFENLSLSTGTDITDRLSVVKKIKESDAQIVLNFAAKTNVDKCEEDKNQDIKILGYKDIKEQEKEFIRLKTAWAVNVLGTQNVVKACEESSKTLVHISTDFVFDGENASEGGYSEEDKENPINWYGTTKYEAEKIIRNSKINWVIARIAYPFRTSFERTDFTRSIIKYLKSGEKIQTVKDHFFTPTFIDDIAFALDNLIKRESKGVFHIVGNEVLTPFDAALKIAEEFSLDKSLVIETTREVYFKNRAKRPFKLAIKNDKIRKLSIEMRSFSQGIEETKKQINQI